MTCKETIEITLDNFVDKYLKKEVTHENYCQEQRRFIK